MNTGNEILQIPLVDIIPNQFQPRMNFDEQELEELAQSIREHGIIQPLVLRKMGQKYEIIAGERRYRAAGMVGLQTVPAIISNVDDQTSAEVALVENVQRKDLTAIEEAKSYKNILDKGYLTQEQLAKKMGLSQPAIANKLRLLNLDESVQNALLDGKISERHARALLAIENKEKQKQWLKKILDQRLTVRQLDMEIKKETNGDGVPLVSIVQNVDKIKENASDIPSNRPVQENIPVDTTNTTPVQEINNEVPKSSNKFFNLLEDEAVNMNTTEEQSSIFNSMPSFNVNPTNTAATNTNEPENKFFNFDVPAEINSMPVEEPVSTPKPEETEEPELETLFDPMDQVELLDPDYEKKQQESAGLDLKTAITYTREEIEKLQEKGFKIEVEEVDLDNKYQIIININK